MSSETVFRKGTVCSLDSCKELIDGSMAAIFPDGNATHVHCAEKYSNINGCPGPGSYFSVRYIPTGVPLHDKPRIPEGWSAF